jgi:glycosyltransferase involved in cell wall biosynthesis
MPSSENFPTITAVPAETQRIAKADRPPAGNLDFSIVIPVYNEAGIIESTLRELESYLLGYAGRHSWEIIVINDGSEDDTLNRLMALGGEMENLLVVDLGCHKGRGMALRQGIGQARGEIIVSIDADLSYAPYHIERMIETMRKNKADLVLASAYSPGGTVEHVPFKRLFLSRWGNKLLSLMFGGKISTFTCLVRAYRRDFINRLDLHSDDKEIHLEILY